MKYNLPPPVRHRERHIHLMLPIESRRVQRVLETEHPPTRITEHLMEMKHALRLGCRLQAEEVGSHRERLSVLLSVCLPMPAAKF